MQKTKVRYLKRYAVCAVLILLVFIFFTKSSVCASGAKKGIYFCIDTVIPAVFPFAVICKLLVYSNAFYGRGIFFLGAVCSSPCCASIVCDMYKEGKINKKTAETLSSYTNNLTPTFVTGFAGSYALSSAYKGFLIYVICIFSSFLYGLLFKKDIKKACGELSFFPSSFTKAVTEGGKSVISVCGYVVFFSVICEFLSLYISTPTTVFFITSFLEITTGTANAAMIRGMISERLLFAVLSFFVSFTGICTQLQVISQLHAASLDCIPFIVGKAVQGVLSFAISYIVYGIIFG